MPPCGATRFRQHVGAVGVRALVVLRSGLAFGVRLHEETAEIRDVAVDLVDLGLPPGAHRRIERIRGLQSAELDRRAEARREIHAHAVRAQHAGERRGLFEVRRRQAGGVGVDVRQHRAVDADRRAGARVVGVARDRASPAACASPRSTARRSRVRRADRGCPSDSARGSACAAAKRCRAPEAAARVCISRRKWKAPYSTPTSELAAITVAAWPLTLTLRIT